MISFVDWPARSLLHFRRREGHFILGGIHKEKLASKAAAMKTHTQPIQPVAPEQYEAVRKQFTYFQPELGYPIFMENAGGSQVPHCVTEAMKSYMQHAYAQLGAGHLIANRADATIQAVRDWMRVFMNAPEGTGDIMIGPATSQMLANLAGVYAMVLKPGDEIIIQETGHEANLGPWARLAANTGATLRTWATDVSLALPAAVGKSNGASNGTHSTGNNGTSMQALEGLLSPATKLVAVTHVSNAIGEVTDVPGVMKLVKKLAPNARVVVDGVAYAPHRLIDVQGWGVDWYVFSTYKVYGPHMAVMYGSADAIKELQAAGARGPNHFFVPPSLFTYTMELGCQNHEGCAGVVAVQNYLRCLADTATDGAAEQYTQSPVGVAGSKAGSSTWQLPPPLTRQQVEDAFHTITAMELPLQQRMHEYLASKPGVMLLGNSPGDALGRVPTFSFAHKTMDPTEIVKQLQARGIACRNGHMYAHRLVTALVKSGALPREYCGGDEEAALAGGVVRISLLHYNTPAEVEAFIAAMDEILP